MTPQPGRIPPFFPSIGQAVLLMLGALFLQVCGGATIAAVAALSAPDGQSGTQVLFHPWTLIAINTLAIGATLSLGLRATRESAAAFFAIGPFSPALLPSILLTSLGLAVVLSETDNLITEMLQQLAWPGGVSPDLLRLADHPGSGFLLLVIVAPLTEEYLLRGMILRGLLTRHRMFVAVGLSALLFGLLHANLRQLFLGAVIGGVFGWWYARTRSVGPGLIGHAVFNAVAWGAILFPVENTPFIHNKPGQPIVHQPWWFTGGGALVAGLGLWWFARIVITPEPVPALPPADTEPPLLASEATPAPPPESSSP
jgi:membrane protease YdiL (CAAX protease family)